MKVLVVENEPLIAMSLCMELEAIGHEVVGPAYTIQVALELIRSEKPDLALLDIDLQHIGDGIVIARVLATHRTPTVFVSGRGDEARRHAGLAVGYISKPYQPQDIADSIEAANALAQGMEPPPTRAVTGFHRF